MSDLGKALEEVIEENDLEEELKDKLQTEDEQEDNNEGFEREDRSEEENFIEVEAEDISELFEKYTGLKAVQFQLAELCIKHEQRKAELIEKFSKTKSEIEEYVDTLKEDYGVPSKEEFTLSLPEEEGQPGVFVKESEETELEAGEEILDLDDQSE